MSRKQKTWILVTATTVLLLLIAGIGWGLSKREDPQVARVRELQAKAFSDDVPREQRRELFEQMRSESENLTDEQRRSLREEAFASRRQEMQQRMTKYFEMSAEERVAYLDAQIDEMEQRRKEWEKRARQRDASGDARRGDGPRRGGFGRGGRRGNATAEQRNDRRRGFLSMSSAGDRAQFVAYIEDLNQRREARGLEPMRRGGFGGRR